MLTLTGVAFKKHHSETMLSSAVSNGDDYDYYYVELTIKNIGADPFDFDMAEVTFSPIIALKTDWNEDSREINGENISREPNRRKRGLGYSDATDLLPNEERIFTFETQFIGRHYDMFTGRRYADHFSLVLLYRGQVVAGPFTTVLKPVPDYPFYGLDKGEVFLNEVLPKK